MVCRSRRTTAAHSFAGSKRVIDGRLSGSACSGPVTIMYRNIPNTAVTSRATTMTNTASQVWMRLVDTRRPGITLHYKVLCVNVGVRRQSTRNGVTEKLVTIPRGGHGIIPRADNQRAYAAIEQFLSDLGIQPVAVTSKSEITPAPAAVRIDSNILNRYAGRYRGGSGDLLTFANRDGRLLVQLASEQNPRELSASGEGEFFVGNNRIWFVPDAESRPYGIIIRNGAGRYSRAERIQ